MPSIEDREAEWRKHLACQYEEYEEFDRNLSDKISLCPGAQPGLPASQDVQKPKKEKKEKGPDSEKKEKKDKKEKKEKKEKKDKKDKDGFENKGVTFLGPTPARSVSEEPPEEEVASAEPVEEESDSPKERWADMEADPVEELVEEAHPLEPPSFQRCGELTWPNLVLVARALVSKCVRIPASEFPARWEEEHGCMLSFPIFGFNDWPALLREFQVGSLIVAKNVLQNSSDAAFAKETARWSKLEELGRSGTISQWLIANFKKELKLVQQSVKEQRGAQKVAETQAEKIRQEHQIVQRNQSGKSAQLRSIKADLDKAEQRANKFRLEAEDKEKQERGILAQIAEEKKAAAGESATADLKSGGYAVQAAAKAQAPLWKPPVVAERTPFRDLPAAAPPSQGLVQDMEDDFM